MREVKHFTSERYQSLKDNRNFNPTSILDIGANRGQWFNTIKEIYPDAEVFSVEANPNCEFELKNVNPNSMITFLGEYPGEIDFYIPSNNSTCTGSSAYIEQTSYYSDVQSKKLPVVTLDSLNKSFDFIKMDVQGAELDIIKGGVKTLSDAKVLQLELSFLEYNKNAPLASEIISFLHVLGYQILDIGDLMYIDGELNQADVFFVNTRKLKEWTQLSESQKNA